MNIKKRLVFVLFAALLAAGMVGNTAAQSMEAVPEVATDPREDWVILPGPEEGQHHPAKCFGPDLKKVKMDRSGWITYWVVNNDPLCSPDAPPANLDPSGFVDPRLTWIVMPSGQNSTSPVRCFGSELHFVEEESNTAQTLVRGSFRDAAICQPAHYEA